MAHILIDARIMFKSTGRYVERLIEHLQEFDTRNRYTILVPKEAEGRWTPKARNFTAVTADFAAYTFGEQLGLSWLIAKAKPDLVHFSTPEQPLLCFAPTVTTIHDLTLLSFVNRRPLGFLKSLYKYTIKPAVFRSLIGFLARRSRHVITPSNYVRGQVIERLKVPSDRVTTTLEAVDELAERSDPVRGLEGVDFVFFVGNAFVYKNLYRLIDAVGGLPNLTLVLAGKRDYYYEELIKYAEQKRLTNVVFPGFVTDEQLVWMYKNAKMYVIPSLSEGFSLTGLEAMHYGLPVASSTATCLPEVYGPAAEYFDPYSVPEMRDAIVRCIRNPQRLSELSRLGREQTAKYSWRRMAEQTFAIYERVLAERSSLRVRPHEGARPFFARMISRR